MLFLWVPHVGGTTWYSSSCVRPVPPLAGPQVLLFTCDALGVSLLIAGVLLTLCVTLLRFKESTIKASSFFLCVFKTESHYIAHHGLEPRILLLQLPCSWLDTLFTPACPASFLGSEGWDRDRAGSLGCGAGWEGAAAPSPEGTPTWLEVMAWVLPHCHSLQCFSRSS